MKGSVSNIVYLLHFKAMVKMHRKWLSDNIYDSELDT